MQCPGRHTVVSNMFDDRINNPSYILNRACEMGHAMMVKILLKHGKACDLTHALEMASERGDAMMVKLLLENGANPDNTSALYLACGNGHTKTVKMLLEYGADPNADYALSAACYGNHPKIAELLLAWGTSKDLRQSFEVAHYRGSTMINDGMIRLILVMKSLRKKQISANEVNKSSFVTGLPEEIWNDKVLPFL